MSQIRDLIEGLPSIDAAVESAKADAGGDEIAAAISRQLDVLEGTTVLLGNALQMLHLQIGNLRSEVALLDQPIAPQAPPQQPQVQRAPSGAIVEATVPEEQRLPGFCGHPDVLRIPTTEGYQVVCPDCDG